MAKTKAPKEIKVDLPVVEDTTAAPARGMEDIQREYGVKASQSGQLQYQVYTLAKDLEILNTQMRELNFEAAALKGKEVQANG